MVCHFGPPVESTRCPSLWERGREVVNYSLQPTLSRGQVSRRVERVQPSAQLGNPLLTVVAESSIVGRDPQVNGVDVCFRFSEANRAPTPQVQIERRTKIISRTTAT